MVVVKTNPVGIDAEIQSLQIVLNAQLPTIWELGDLDYKGYGRCYRNQTINGRYVPEIYYGGEDYKEMLLDDTVPAMSFFDVNSPATTGPGSKMTASVSVLFFINLSKVYPDVTHRADEEVRRDALRIMQAQTGMVTGVVTGINNVLSEFTGFNNIESMKYRDMHPYHCFRITMDVMYSSNDYCNNPININ